MEIIDPMKYLFQLIAGGKVDELRTALLQDPRFKQVLQLPSGIRTWETDTLLHIACCLVSVEIVKLLIDHGAPVNVLNGKDFTPLSYAVLSATNNNRPMTIVQVLLDHGADPSYALHFVQLFPAEWKAYLEAKLREFMFKQGVQAQPAQPPFQPQLQPEAQPIQQPIQPQLQPQSQQLQQPQQPQPQPQQEPEPQLPQQIQQENTYPQNAVIQPGTPSKPATSAVYGVTTQQEPVNTSREPKTDEKKEGILKRLWGWVKSNNEYQSILLMRLAQILGADEAHMKTVSESPAIFVDVLNLFSEYDETNRRKSGENIFAEDVKQLALFFGGWLDQMFKQKKYSDTLFVVWLFLKLKQYDRLLTSREKIEMTQLEQLLFAFLSAAGQSQALSYNILETCYRVNNPLFNSLVYQLEAYPEGYDRIKLDNRLRLMPVAVFGLLGIFTSLIKEPTSDPKLLWKGFLQAIPIYGARDAVVPELGRFLSVVSMINSMPNYAWTPILFQCLDALATPAPVDSVRGVINVFPVSTLDEKSFEQLASCFDRLLELHPSSMKASDFHKEWVAEVETICKQAALFQANPVGLLSNLLFPVLLRCLRTNFALSTIFKDIFHVRTRSHSFPADIWNAAVRKCISRVFEIAPTYAGLKITQLKVIPPELVQGEVKEKMLGFISEYVNVNLYRSNPIVSAEIICPMIDSYFSDVNARSTFDEIILPFETLCKAIFANKLDNFSEAVASFLVLPWRAQNYSNLFNADNPNHLARIKQLLNTTMFVQSSPHKVIGTVESRLSQSEKDHSTVAKFPPLYQLLVQAMGELVVGSFFASLQVINPVAQVAEMSWWFVSNGFIPANAANFEKIKFQLPFEIVNLFALLYANHGRKVRGIQKLRAKEQTCPICSEEFTRVDMHFKTHAHKQGSFTCTPAQEIAKQTYLANVDQFQVLFNALVSDIVVQKQYTRQEAELIINSYPTIRCISLLFNVTNKLPNISFELK